MSLQFSSPPNPSLRTPAIGFLSCYLLLLEGGITCHLNCLMSLRVSYLLFYMGNHPFYFLPVGLDVIGWLDKNKLYICQEYGLFISGNHKTT